MELLFVVVIAACLGAIARYTLPRRSSYGLVLLPALAAAVAAIVWVALTWAGMPWDGGWIWAITLVVATGAAIATALILPRSRDAADERLFAELNSTRRA